VLRPLLTGNNAWNAGYGGSNYGQFWTIDQLMVALTGYVNSTTSYRVLDVCLSLNGGASCASSTQQTTMGQSSSQQAVGQADTSQFGVIPWLLDTNPRFNVQESSPHSGTATVAGNTVTWLSGDMFSLYWVTGGNGHIRLSANNDACTTSPNSTTSTEYAITDFVDGNHLTVSGTPPVGNVHWCANNFAVLVWRDQAPTDGSVVTLTRASMAVVESSIPTYPDNGAGTACYNTPVSNGSGQNGYFCMYGGLYWIDPTAPDHDAYYGYGSSGGTDRSATPITNTWNGFGFPLGESADLDQTKSVFTFYSVALDPAGGGPLVIQGVFNPSSVSQPISQPTTPQRGGAQIGNASVSSTTAYSVTYNNGLTFTNLTPQTSMHKSVVQQMAVFDPTFNPIMFSTGPNGWNCSPAAMSTGVFYFLCLSIGGDSPGWVFAFSPGDGNPAHAGAAGGPRIIGAVNTFNTPNGPVIATQTAATGRSLHAVTETGETGWVQLQMNPYPSINTSNISGIPATSADCSTFGLPAGKQCIQIDINSHTGGGVTGYDSNLPAPQSQFKGAPGELRTAQLGDTACVAASTVSTCSWPSQRNELMTLAIKNYNGVEGAWVFQRNGYGAELAIPSGPVTLWWISNQSSIPAGAITENGSLAAYWNALAGCNGAPDPHGNCMMQDSNNTSGHGEWRDGGEAVATNVPAWSRPIYGWPSAYQTAVGSVPGILELPFANVTPGRAGGVNYTSANPPFSGMFGVPWGFDAGSHPDAAGANDPNNGKYAFDNIPVQGGANDPAFTRVTGQLYAAGPPSPMTDPDNLFGSGVVASIDRKLMATGASCGSHPLIDLSGPGSSIAADASGSYTYCIARVNGECVSGSSVGQIYVNCPGVVWDHCSGSGIHGGTPLGVGNDICVANIGAAANAVRQFSLDHTDFAGAFTRTLVSATSRLRMVTGFENNRLLPDNSWLLFRAEWLNYSRQDMWMAKMLPYPTADSINRGTFVPRVLNLQPPADVSVDNAVVEFGYTEYYGNCTSRHDPCLANAAMIGVPPFRFASENPRGMPCSSGCTITIPAISQRILYYQVKYRDKSNHTQTTSRYQVAVVP